MGLVGLMSRATGNLAGLAVGSSGVGSSVLPMTAPPEPSSRMKPPIVYRSGAVDAARLCLAAGRPEQAASLIGRLSAKELSELEDEGTLAVAAGVMLESGRRDDAVRILQGLKRRGSATGAVRMLLGRAFLDSGLVELAEEELRAAGEMPMEPGEQLRASYLLGCVLETRGQNDEALRVFHEVMQHDMHFLDVQERYRRIRALTASKQAG
jgi:hypothetical protein